MIDGVLFTVVGVSTGSEELASASLDVFIPATTLASVWPTKGRASQVFAVVPPGSATRAAEWVAPAIDPEQPDCVEVSFPPDPIELRSGVESTVSSLALLTAGAFGLGGAAFVLFLTWVSVRQRWPEFGYRRAMGASQGRLRRLVMGEVLAVALPAAVVGVAAGLGAVWVAASAADFTPYVPGWSVPAAVVGGVALAALGAVGPDRIALADFLRNRATTAPSRTLRGYMLGRSERNRGEL